MMLVCEVCNEAISNLKDGLVVIARDDNRKYKSGHIVHKGNCDTILEKIAETKGLNTNSSMEVLTLENENNVRYYQSTGELPFER